MKYVLSGLLIIVLSVAQGQSTNNQQTPPTNPATVKPISPPKMVSMDEALKGKKEISGLFTLYRDTTTGTLSMLVKKENEESQPITLAKYTIVQRKLNAT